MKAAFAKRFRCASKLLIGLAFASDPLGVSHATNPAPPARFNPEIVQALKTNSIEKVFTEYKAGYEFSSRTEAARLHEILSRPEAVEFLSTKLKKDRVEPDTRERIESREKAAHILGKMDSRAKPAVPLLIACLEDDDEVRRRVTDALAELGPLAAQAKPALLEELHFQNSQAARALFKIDPTSEESLNSVIEAISDPSNEQGFRSQSIEAFYECKANPARVRAFLQTVAKENNWIADSAKRQLEMVDWRTNRQTGSALPRGWAQPPGPPAETDAAALLDRLKSNADDYPTAQELTKFNSDTRRQAVEILLDALKQNKVGFPINIVSRIGLFGPDARVALPILIESADSDQSGLANNSMSAIGEIGPDAITAKPVVERALSDLGDLLRWRAANTLCFIDPANFDAHLERLLQVLKEDDTNRYSDYGVRALAKFGPRAKAATPFLLEKLNDENLRPSAAEALAKIATDHDIKFKVAVAITKDLTHEFIYTRDRVARILGELGPDARAALPALKEAANSDDSEFAKIAKDSIQKIEAAKE